MLNIAVKVRSLTSVRHQQEMHPNREDEPSGLADLGWSAWRVDVPVVRPLV